MHRPVFDEVRRIGKFEAGASRAVIAHIIPHLNEPIPEMEGFGVATAAGGRYLRYLWVMVKKLRAFSDAPVQCFHLGQREIMHHSVPMLEELGVEFVDALPLMKAENYQKLGGWQAKSIAVKYSRFERICFMDADAYPLMDPEDIQFDQFMAWHDIQKCRKNDMIWPSLGLKCDRAYTEFEAGQQMWDRRKAWRPLQLFSWANGRPKPFYDLLHGDKDIAPFMFLKLGIPFETGGPPRWEGYGIRHFLKDGTPAFFHAMPEKRGGPPDPDSAALLAEFDSLTGP
jgi:hypothetical protein